MPLAMAAGACSTTITIPTSIRQALERYKRSGQSYVDVLLKFMEELPPEEYLDEMERHFRAERRYPLARVLRDAGR